MRPVRVMRAHACWRRRIGLNLYQTYSIVTAGNYTAPLLLGISKASLLAGGRATPAYAAVTDWDRDVTFTLAPSLTQARAGPCAAITVDWLLPSKRAST